jgi:TonB-linked SusC/RagA family outer membrane protein
MNTYNTRLGRDTLPGFRSGEDLNHFNWQDFVFDPASKQKYKLTVSGGSDKATYLVSGNYFKQEGIVRNSGLDKYSLRLNTTQNIGKRIKTGQNLIVTYSSRNRINENGTGVNASPIANTLKADPSATPYYSDLEMDSLEIDEELNWGQWRELERTPAVSNPASNLDRKSYIYDSWHYFGTAFIDIEILPSLVFHSTFGLDLNTGQMEEFEPFYKVNAVEKTPRTIFRLREEEWLNWDSENTLTFQKVFGNHDITAMAGFTAQKERFEDLRHTAVGFPYLEESLRYMNLTDPDILTEVKSSPMSYAFLSLLGRVMYAYSDKILVTASIRRDGSSYFAENYRYGYFPSYSLGYKISEEGFFQGLGLPINLLKFRAGYGELGNAAIRPNLFNPLMTNHTVGAAFNDPKEFYTGAMPEGLTNEDARWETTRQYNFAMDLGLWKNKFTFTFDYFVKQTEDLLIQYPLPKMSGAQSFERVGGNIPPLFVNAANMDNKGFEITTNYKFSLGDLRVSVSGNLSYVQNNVKSLADGLPIQSNEVREFGGFLSKTEAGLPVASYYGYVVEGIYQSYDEIREHLSEDAANVDPYTYDRTLEPNPLRNIAPGDYKFKDIDNNGIINSDDREYIGSPLPDFTYGGAINGQYKSLDFSLSLAGVQGNEVVNVMDFYLASYGGTNKYKGYSDTWSTGNTDAKYPRMETDVNDNRRFSTAYIEDGSYMKINNFTIGFTLPDNLVQRVNISKTRAYFTVSNMYTFTKYSTGYPEVGLSTRYNAKPLDFGVDRLVYPLPRVFMLGLDVSF